MRRDQFTFIVGQLILWISAQGWFPLIGHAERGDAEQLELFKKRLSNCDGVEKVSNHQYRKAGGAYAVDIFIHDGDGNIDKIWIYKETHAHWTVLGGGPMISLGQGRLDGSHFEVLPGAEAVTED